MAGPFPYPESSHPESSPQQPFPASDPRATGPVPYPGQVPYSGQAPYPGQVPSAYPGALPPPVNYPKAPRRKRFLLLGAGLLIVALVAAGVVTLVLSADNEDAAVTVNDGNASTAIQGYLDALAKGDDETIARNNSCGFFDAIQDKRSDMTLANLTSDAFRRQFGSASVAKIDKIVALSPNQAQVLFTMRAKPAGRSQGEVERQGVAQLLVLDRDILVCSYLPRSTGQY